MNEEQDNIMEPPTKKQKTDNDNDREIDTVQDTELTEDVAETDKEFVANNDKYNNFVTPEELDMLREFKVLDEVKSNDEDSNDEESDSSDGKSVGLPEDEIEKMLEEDLPEDFKGAPKLKEKAYIIRPKIVLEEKGINQFEVLPLDWMLVRHYSGMPVYMHRTTRVCTLSKPYFLGKGNTRRHDIPISAIPCLAYRRALEEEEKQKEIDRRIEEQIRTGNYAKHTNVNHESQVDSNKEINCTSDVNQTRNADEQESNRVTKAVCPFNNTSAIEANRNKNDETNNEANTISDKEENTISSCSEDTKLDVHTDQTNTAAAVQTDQSNTAAAVDVTDIPPHRQPVVLPGGIVMPPPRVETVNTSWKTQHLSTEQINNYCKNLFKFKTVNIMHFKRWADRRKYTKARKTLQYPTLPEGTKLITIPAQPTPGQENGGRSSKRDWVMNMNGRSYLSVFHEYVRRALQKQPVYEFKQLQNASSPYQATVFIGGMQYGVGHGSSKRQAKSHAARASIHILIPEMKDDLDFDLDYSAGPRPARPSTTAASTATSTATSTAADGPTDADFTFFDYVGIEDPRITEFCAATCEPSPHAILRTCLLRNFGAGDRHIHTEMKKLEYQKIELTMKVGKHTATVVCKNKKTAKQRASQAILQGLHPHVRSWGSLLRLYGSRSVKSCKEKKLEEQQITLLQDKARHNEPNYAVLEKLRNEMQKLKARDAAVVPIGTLMLTDHALPDHSGANLNNVDL